MNQQQARTIADRFIGELQRLEQGDPASADSLTQMFAPDAELLNPLIEEHEGHCRRGHDQISAFWRQYASTLGGIHSDFFDITTNEHSAGLFWRSNGTGPSGKPLKYEGVSLLMFDDAGRIVRFQGFFDTRQMTFRVGAVH